MNDPTAHKRLGKGMMIAAWVVGVAMLTMIFSQWDDHRRNPNSNPDSQVINGVREVTLKENTKSHYMANGTINGQPVTFMLDTGATDVVVPAELALKLGLKASAKGMAMTANGVVEVGMTRIDELTLGNILLHDVRASINPGMQGEEVLLGMSALKQVDFSQKDGRLVLRQGNSEG